MIKHSDIVAHMNRIVAQRAEPVKHAGNIILPDVSIEHPLRCTVIAVGPDVKGFEPGDIVLIGANKFLEFKLNEHEEPYVFVSPEAVLCKLRS